MSVSRRLKAIVLSEDLKKASGPFSAPMMHGKQAGLLILMRQVNHDQYQDQRDYQSFVMCVNGDERKIITLSWM